MTNDIILTIYKNKDYTQCLYNLYKINPDRNEFNLFIIDLIKYIMKNNDKYLKFTIDDINVNYIIEILYNRRFKRG